MLPPPPSSTLFPYTTLFRSAAVWCSTSSTASSSARGDRTGSRTPAAACVRTRSRRRRPDARSEEHTSELQSLTNLVCRLLLEKKKTKPDQHQIIYNLTPLHLHLAHRSTCPHPPPPSPLLFF